MEKPDVICITETTAKNARYALTSSEIQLDGFDLHENLNPRRGVAIYTAQYLQAAPVEFQAKYPFEEHCWTKVSLRNQDSLLLGCVYRSPNSLDENNERLFEMIADISKTTEYTHLLIILCRLQHAIHRPMRSFWKACLQESFLFQHVTQATHKRRSNRKYLRPYIDKRREHGGQHRILCSSWEKSPLLSRLRFSCAIVIRTTQPRLP